MKSFTLIAVGRLASDPELTAKADTTYTRFCLIGDDYAGRDGAGEEKKLTTSIYFVAFNSIAQAIARHARKGDQLIIDGFVQSNNWTDKDGEKRYDYSFVIQNFRFGAPGKIKREQLAALHTETEAALETET